MNSLNAHETASGGVSQEPGRKRRGPVLIMIGSGLLLLITLLILVGYFFLFSKDASSRPLVQIHDPGNGDRLEIGERVTVHATARDENNITRMEFWVGDTLQEVETSGVSEGITPFPMLVSWTPDTPGEHTLTFRAFNSQGGRASGYILVNAVAGDERVLDGAGDADGDGVADGEDACPDLPGAAELEGCPDRDGDGVPDHEDLAPDEPGDPEAGGAPGSEAGDRDGDGAADDHDPCPDEPGEPEDGFCPPPDRDEGEEPMFGFDFPLFFGVFTILDPVNIEVEGLQFQVGREYDHVWCYLQLGDQPVERYEFEPQGEQTWDMAQALGGENSIRMIANRNSPLSLMLQCRADVEFLGPEGGWGTVYDLGTYTYSHQSAEWDGRQLLAISGSPEADGFMASYRICSPSCDETAIQPPILHPVTLGPTGTGPYRIGWQWEGEEEWLERFLLIVNGNYYDPVASIPADRRRIDIGDFRPTCGSETTFQLVAVGRNPGESLDTGSAPSNIQVWDPGGCPRTLLVSFLSLDGAGLGGRVGPLSGTFMANDQTLIADYRDGPPSFDATDDTKRYLDAGTVYNLGDLFEAIETEAWSCIGGNCTSNYAPSVISLEVELNERQSLTFGGSIWTERDGRAFEGFEVLEPGEVTPGEYTISQNGITLTVGIDVLVGPEAGGAEALPDLVITDVTMNEEGQLVIHVFNNAADLVEEQINIAVVRMSTNEQIDFLTWEGVTIPAGGHRYLISPSAATEPYDLRLLLDPVDAAGGDGIRETNELNNVYETPVTMRVQILEYAPGDPCESFLNTESEFVFRTFVGHRSPDGEVTWIAELYNPWSGVLEVETYPEWIYHGTWDVREEPGFNVEFQMPASHSLVLFADGNEIDSGLASNDYAGRVNAEYSVSENYGDQADNYHYSSEGWHDCPDGTPLGWDTNNFHIWWNITRIH